MKKQISFSGTGQRADINGMTIFRILPNRYADAVGAFVFLDHIAPKIHTNSSKSGTTGAHPHRGIATLTYILDGEGEHFDSAGHYAKVHSGGVQWMKAGNGIVHDESFSYDTQKDTKLTHGFQFWLTLPSKIKAEKPAYLSIQAGEVPQKILANEAGWLKVIVGNYEDLSSKIPNYTEQFLYHIRIEASKTFVIEMKEQIEVAAFLPLQKAMINDEKFEVGEFIEFDRKQGLIEITNTNDTALDVLLFGGEKYDEPIVAEGPFVMNSSAEIAEAYRDYFNKKYGEIDYEGVKNKA